MPLKQPPKTSRDPKATETGHLGYIIYTKLPVEAGYYTFAPDEEIPIVPEGSGFEVWSPGIWGNGSWASCYTTRTYKLSSGSCPMRRRWTNDEAAAATVEARRRWSCGHTRLDDDECPVCKAFNRRRVTT